MPETSEHILLICQEYDDLRLGLLQQVGFHLILSDDLFDLVGSMAAYEELKMFALSVLERRNSLVRD
ncbi:hypothetical protein O3M35_006576 [Rhynocoris fuscipes]|uniref:Uncharacterized protein n=1 Tax=Rhynocoris fuscipes TaxID=488301 RepID=A0AAW1DHR0_9HEMI